ncbi:HAD family hydrolase [candidate division KSB3 bacterium]|uniref:HAD family hydrolase n=1 Tax=candidate division KSB3 bacterium TaxID=2044937 RepID=A0A2G6KJD1_9BACT|nr:MAG: HAD family hydrolase [candidate division KSB3 bacterium]
MTASHPQPINAIPESFCKALRYFFTDIDDTMTHNGLLPAEAYQAIWQLSEQGIGVIPVTGRPAGWCDHFARMWPVEGVVGENGAFYFSYDRSHNRMNRVYLLDEAERQEGQRRLETIRRRVLAEVPGCGISADQPYRIVDLAIDFCEDVASLSKEGVQDICRIAEEEGATYKVSSIHVNCWYGDHNKVACFERFLKDFTGHTLAEMQSSIVFVGDSPNDEPMFQELEHTIAVANIKNFLADLQHHPTYITTHEAGLGFAEAVEIILQKRAQ